MKNMNEGKERDTGLASRALIVNVSIKRLPASKKDKEVTRETIAKHGAKSDAGAFWRAIFSDEDRKPFTQLESKIRKYVYSRTLPWTDDGQRLVKSSEYMEFARTIGEYQREYWHLAEEFQREFAVKKERAKKSQGDMFREDEFPTADELDAMFGFGYDVYPIPNCSDIRVVSNFSEEERNEIEKLVAMKMEAKTRKALSDIGNRVSDVLTKLVERLKDPKAIYRDSLINNVKELVEVIPKVDVTESEKLEKIRQRLIHEICGLDPEELRDNLRKREETVKKAEEISKAMDDFFGKEE